MIDLERTSNTQRPVQWWEVTYQSCVLSCASIHLVGSVCSLACQAESRDRGHQTNSAENIHLHCLELVSYRPVPFHSNLRQGVQAATQLGCLHSSPDVPRAPRNGTATERGPMESCQWSERADHQIREGSACWCMSVGSTTENNCRQGPRFVVMTGVVIDSKSGFARQCPLSDCLSLSLHHGLPGLTGGRA